MPRKRLHPFPYGQFFGFRRVVLLPFFLVLGSHIFQYAEVAYNLQLVAVIALLMWLTIGLK
ncbi:hypothetical protein CDL12_03282 [Handroanthus impetiginosus]|uniref:Uncharacterized protein n=1 Tax=Handroanthus impetiginosus TaxID=429701 RepID=A0A2G9I2J8_9LAMI|nr:hypothetical protein CDL12_03282 [Handroanthus impetiginosus]